MKEKKAHGVEKKAHGVQLLLRCVVRNPDGKVISDTGRKPARSFVIQWLEFLWRNRSDVGGKATDVDGAESNIMTPFFPYSSWMDISAAVNVDTHGVVVGTGDTAATNTDYKLDTQLTQGVGAGNITHGAVDVGTTAVVGANVDLEVKRAFTNLTGSTITVKEAGVYIISSNKYHCIIRDVLAGAVEVPDKCSLTVIYTARTTV